MGKITGFMEYERIEEGYKPVPERLKHYKEFVIGLDESQAKVQAARCMDCGTPFCNNGCPVNNIIPDFNDLVYQATGRARSTCCTAPTTSPSSPAASAPPRAKRPARST
jgi:glutamate synthase (NADPH/NADH) small chain